MNEACPICEHMVSTFVANNPKVKLDFGDPHGMCGRAISSIGVILAIVDAKSSPVAFCVGYMAHKILRSERFTIPTRRENDFYF